MSEQLSSASSPWNAGEDNGERDKRRRMRRMAEHVVVALLAILAVTIAIGSWPVWHGAARGYRADAARRGIERHARQRGWAVGEPKKKAASRYAPRPESYGAGSPNLLEELLGHPELDPVSAEGRPAVARGRIQLYDRADDDADIVLDVDPTVTLLVAKDLGRWLLVAVQKGERTQYGWVRRHEVLVLP